MRASPWTSPIIVALPVAVPLLRRRRRALRAVALCSTAVTMGLPLAHALELPARRRLDARQWWLTRLLYLPWFGRAGHAEGVALLAAPALAGLVPSARRSALAAWALLLIANPGVFLPLVAPTNHQTLRLVDPPGNWRQLRDRWEFGHLARFACHAGALGVLVIEAAGDSSNER